MSEENRFIKNKKTIVLSISLVVACILAGVFGISFVIVNDKYNDLSGDYGDYNELYTDYLELLNDFNNLENEYSILSGEHIELENDYNALVLALNNMTAERDALLLVCDELLQDIIALETIITGLNFEIIALENTITGLQTTIIGLQDEIFTLTAERDALLLALENLEDDMDELEAYYLGLIAGLNSEIAVLEAERDALVIALADMTALRDSLQSDLDAMTIERDNLVIDLSDMTAERDALQIELDDLTAIHDALLGDYQILFDAYNELQTIYNTLLIAYDYITDTIRQSILPVQYCIFAEAVRRYYMDMYLEGKTGKNYWMSFAEYCRDVILHDSWQENSFVDVSNAFSDALRFGNDTMYLAWEIMYYTFFDWLPNWDGWDLTGNELIDIDTIVDWCITEIDYEYDSDIIYSQEYFEYDYIKFPVETAFRTMGDCEDQAILTSAYLESCGFDTAILISHDPNHPAYGEFYHGSLWVHIEDRDAFWSLYPTTRLWSIDGGINLWCWLDTTWNIPFGSTPEWLQYYIDFEIPLTWDIISLAICDIGGTVETNIMENLGLTYVMPS